MGNMAQFGINMEEDSKGAPEFAPIPEGQYTVIITKTEIAQTKAGNGTMVKASMQIVDGDYSGRMVWTNFNIQNENPEAQKIGRAEFARCCMAAGVNANNPDFDTSELHDIPMNIRLAKDKKDPTRNNVKSFSTCGRPNSAPSVEKESAPVAEKPVVKPPVMTGKPSKKTGTKPWG